jgi:hypothetical protein
MVAQWMMFLDVSMRVIVECWKIPDVARIWFDIGPIVIHALASVW